MIKTSLCMLWKEKKRSYSLCVIISLTVAVTIILLHFFENPTINPNKDSTSIFILLDYFFKATIIVSVIIICICLIVYACNYYNRFKSREIAMLKMSGCTNLQVVQYQIIQMLIISISSAIAGLLLSFLIIPVLQFYFYSLLNVNDNIFFYNETAYYQAFLIFIILIIVIVFVQIKYILTTPIINLLRNNVITAYKVKKHELPLIEYVYIFSYFLGLLSVYMGALSQGLLLPSFLSAIGAYGMAKLVIPKYLFERIRTNDLEPKMYLVYSNYVLIIQQLKTLILFFMIMLCMLSTMVLVTYYDIGYCFLFQLAYVISMILVSYSFVNRFKINRINKEKYYDNLSRLGLTTNEIKKMSIKEIIMTYVSVFFIAIVYLVNIILQFVINDMLPFFTGIIIVLELVIPLFVALVVTLLEEGNYIKKWKK